MTSKFHSNFPAREASNILMEIRYQKPLKEVKLVVSLLNGKLVGRAQGLTCEEYFHGGPSSNQYLGASLVAIDERLL